MTTKEIAKFINDLALSDRLGRIRETGQGLTVEILHPSWGKDSKVRSFRVFPDVCLVRMEDRDSWYICARHEHDGYTRIEHGKA